MISRRSSGSIRAESAVEPTKSENITVTWRRSAASTGGARGYSIRRGPRRLCTGTKRSTGVQELESSAKRNTDLAEMILRQIVQNRIVDGVLAECRLILFEAKAPQPTSEVHRNALTCPARMMVPAKQRVHCTDHLLKDSRRAER